MTVLITAGATRNPVDAVRILTARSTGKTGVGIARALVARGVSVHLLGSAEACLRAPELASEEYGSTRDLMARMKAWVQENPGGHVVHSCAVGDYEMAEQTSRKIPSGMDRLVLELVRTPKIADHIRAWGLSGHLVTFKAAGPDTSDDELVRIASAQRERTGSSLVFANVLGRLGHRVALVGDEVRWFDDRADGVTALISELASAHP